MTLKKADIASVPDSQCSTVLTPSAFSEPDPAEPAGSSIPWPGSSYIIRSISTGKVIAFKDGRIVLASLGGHEAIRWRCVEKNGWLGFQNPASSMFLGYDRDKDSELCCLVKRQNDWENFCVRQRPEGGYVLLMSHYENVLVFAWKGLRPVGIKMVHGEEKLGTIDDWQNDTIAWEFIKV